MTTTKEGMEKANFEKNILEATNGKPIEAVLAALIGMRTRGREYKDWRGKYFGAIERRWSSQELYDALLVVFRTRASAASTQSHPIE